MAVHGETMSSELVKQKPQQMQDNMKTTYLTAKSVVTAAKTMNLATVIYVGKTDSADRFALINGHGESVSGR